MYACTDYLSNFKLQNNGNYIYSHERKKIYRNFEDSLCKSGKIDTTE